MDITALLIMELYKITFYNISTYIIYLQLLLLPTIFYSIMLPLYISLL